MNQISEYITKKVWVTFIKRHMDAIDKKKTFEDQPNNIDAFTKFIHLAFNLFIQEKLLGKEVNDTVKNLNYLTVDMKIYTANGKDILQKIDINSLLRNNSNGQQ